MLRPAYRHWLSFTRCNTLTPRPFRARCIVGLYKRYSQAAVLTALKAVIFAYGEPFKYHSGIKWLEFSGVVYLLAWICISRDKTRKQPSYSQCYPHPCCTSLPVHDVTIAVPLPRISYRVKCFRLWKRNLAPANRSCQGPSTGKSRGPCLQTSTASYFRSLGLR